jgi:solute carrier family 45, member 1/2/4
MQTVAVVAGILLPYLASHDKRLLKGKEIDDEDEEDEEMSRIRQMVHKWRMEARQKGMSVKLPAMSFKLRDIWTASLVLFAILMFSTFFVKTVNAVRYITPMAPFTLTGCRLSASSS